MTDRRGTDRPGPVIGDAGRQARRKRLAIATAGSVLLVAAAAAAAAGVWWHVRSAPPPPTPQARHSQVLRQAAASEQDRDYAGQAKALQAYIDSNPPDKYAETEVIRLAAAYQNAKDYADALKWYQLAVDRYPASKLAGIQGMAYTYLDKGDYQQAIDYFQKAKTFELSDPSTAGLAADEDSNIQYARSKMQ